jgi:hypothetical protein
MDVMQLLTPMKTLITEPNLYIGLVQLGSEDFFASENVTFTMSDYSVDIEPNGTSTNSNKPSTSAKPSRGTSKSIPNWQSLAGTVLIPVALLSLFAY